MINPDDNNLDNQDDYLNDNDDTRPEAGNADAAELNERQFEESVAYGDRDNVPDSNTDTARFNSGEQNEAVEGREDDAAENIQHISQRPLTTQGDDAELEENLGGTTNLTLDQLKQERDPEGRAGE